MTAQSAYEYDSDDPVEILRALPNQFHEQFLAEYDAAVADARRPEHYRELHHLLRLAAACRCLLRSRVRGQIAGHAGIGAHRQTRRDTHRGDRPRLG